MIWIGTFCEHERRFIALSELSWFHIHANIIQLSNGGSIIAFHEMQIITHTKTQILPIPFIEGFKSKNPISVSHTTYVIISGLSSSPLKHVLIFILFSYCYWLLQMWIRTNLVQRLMLENDSTINSDVRRHQLTSHTNLFSWEYISIQHVLLFWYIL